MFIFQTDFVSANPASFVFAPLRRCVHTGCPCLALMSILPSSSSSLPLKNYWKFSAIQFGRRREVSRIPCKSQKNARIGADIIFPFLFCNLHGHHFWGKKGERGVCNIHSPFCGDPDTIAILIVRMNAWNWEKEVII